MPAPERDSKGSSPLTVRATVWTLVGVGSGVALLVLGLRWSGAGSSGGGHGFDVGPEALVPLTGVLALPLTAIAWVRDRRKTFLEERRRRPIYVTLLVLGLLWMATLPLGDVVMGWSAAVSKDRALEVAAAAESFRAVTGRWPESIQELEARIGRGLPRPSLGGEFRLLLGGTGSLAIDFASRSRLATRHWTYYVGTGRWDEYTE